MDWGDRGSYGHGIGSFGLVSFSMEWRIKAFLLFQDTFSASFLDLVATATTRGVPRIIDRYGAGYGLV